MRGTLVLLGLVSIAAPGCGQWQRVGSETAPKPATVVPGLFDLSGAYRRMGFLAHGPPVAFVAAARFLAGPVPDSTLVLLSISLANNTLSFRRAGPQFEAAYKVEASVRVDGAVRQLTSEQTVRVARFQETQRADESVIFQQAIHLPAGKGQLVVTVHDLSTGGYSRDSGAIAVPRFDSLTPAYSSIVPFYAGVPRPSRASSLELLLNPRSTVPYGGDTLRLYLEGYGVPAESAVAFRAVDDHANEVWRTTATFRTATGLVATVALAEPGVLPIGELQVQALLSGGRDTVSAPLLVSFSEQWVVANFDEVLSLLRYFGYAEKIRALREAVPVERADLWRQFWRETDPNPATPENEALNEYFDRLQQANVRFREGGDPGWLTDRGEVFINLGEPDEVFDQSSDLQGRQRAIRWSYTTERLNLEFLDESGFGRFRLTPSSRAEYQRALLRVRDRWGTG